MIAITAVLGAGIGLGVWIAIRSLLVSRPALPEIFERFDRTRPMPPPPSATSASSLERVMGTAAVRTLQLVGADPARRSVELRITERSTTRHALDKLIGVTGGAGTPVMVVAALAALGIGIPPAGIVVLTLASAAAGWVLPDTMLREQANKRRRAFRHALSAYLDLVNVIIAGGGGIQTALYKAADAGDGWAFASIRRALDRARLTNRSPWDSFAELADELDVPELAELAASVALAGTHGARIRASLAAKADTLRGHQVAETEAAAESATERMTIPVAVLLFGFLLFIAYPAVQQITTVTGPPAP